MSIKIFNDLKKDIVHYRVNTDKYEALFSPHSVVFYTVVLIDVILWAAYKKKD